MRKWMTTASVLIAALGGIGACTTSSDSCLAEGTLVSTPDGLRTIESLRAGDVVLVADPRARRPSARRILQVARHELRETFVIDAGSSHMRVTGEHPVWVANRDAWVEADKILVGDVVCVLEGDVVRERVVEALRRDKVCVAVFDLSLDGPERTFFADGILVHNKSWPPSCDPTSPYYNGSESLCGGHDGGAVDRSDGAPADSRVDAEAGTVDANGPDASMEDAGGADSAPDVADGSAG